MLIALLSINVAVFNLLPIPILDGGQILINVIESAKGSPFSMRTREYILRVGLFAIALLFAIVMYNDTRAGFVKLFGWVGKLFRSEKCCGSRSVLEVPPLQRLAMVTLQS